MDYDVLILGGGIVGCAVAYELSKYNINIALIEKDYDVANDVSLVNTAVVYDGSETSDYVMAKLENSGMKLIQKHCEKFNLPYKRVGALRISSNDSGNKRLDIMYNKANERGILGVHLIEDNAIYDIEPNLKIKAEKALYSENIAVISPYNLAISYAEVAADNGVNFRLEEEVIDIKNVSKGFKVTTNKNKFTCKFVVNTIPSEIFAGRYVEGKNEVINKKMNYILFNENLDNYINSVIINDIDEDAFVINIPTASKENLIGIKGYDFLSLEDGLQLSKSILQDVKKEVVMNIFTETYSKGNTLIDDNKIQDGYIKVTGSHYSKITIAPAIAEKIEESLKTNMNITKKRDYVDKNREMYTFKNMSKEQRNEIIALDSRYGNIICSCNNVTEGEIIDCIRRPLGARTVEGVKRRTGIGLGSCNGSYCKMKIIKILAREMNESPLSIVYDSMDSKVLVSRIKEFNEI
ncbi:NAD(P)/FAD-dependent oxidoreductase [Clostridium saccharobutylicum]|uniref:FAD dependent oxidoreductase n=1 Tax=Clostridium saccharobutylicum DSM 13864 TaxID=1345695 RepID=U5MKN8_CLOSA|nr:FAD-dependent oxidoreductase [Clostridium saccharobutylicum]AGX41093.1 FAD dependent oxidoreductase [Clostridium saccharobutylicum DSM 13864]AQR88379.1 L-2-hydroxyglutarate oxidase LhgO [Clostridium saccharobutylicum]AQR98277.1 L-2-hydroxyglutarate oxidase LhgO [Clostridium saccharobutylicum]AQS12267.1 L-2-hydroxyglutarate oxidase LhgO [Clostridium saccharobutylicum]MBA2906091.1 L-2-hydroxyglutarate oxidase LhgO [Clostridium saccharobutylicum]